MKPVRATAWALIAVVLGAPASSASAQDVATCSYDACALRIEPSIALFSRGQLVRGVAGEEVTDIGIFGSGLVQAVSSNDSAFVHAVRFERKARSGFGLGVVGLGIASVGYFPYSDDLSTSDLTLVLSGLVVSAIGSVIASSGSRDLNRSIWWFNRQFAGD